MGLGKTIQATVFLRYLMQIRGEAGPYLIIVPLSTLENFKAEISKWLPFAYVVPLCGSKASRAALKRHEFEGDANFDIILTSFEVMRKEVRSLRAFKWRVLIVDEAHRLKNEASKIFSALTDFPADFRLLLTGTPLQNSLQELVSLLRFLDPSGFKNTLSSHE